MAKKKRKRPIFLSILLVSAFVFALLGLMLVFSHEIRRMGDWFPALFGLLIALKFIALVGIWYMKRWGLNMFILIIGTTLITEILMENVGVGGVLTVIMASIIIIVCMKNHRRLTRGL